MLPHGQKPNHFGRQYTPLKGSNARNFYSLNNRHPSTANLSPRPIGELKQKDRSILQNGDQMRLLKSRLVNLSINSRNSMGDNKFYPQQLIFLISNEQGNINHMRRIIEQDKKRINRDFDNFTRQILHLIEDLKLSLNSQLDIVLKDFMNLYIKLKNQVVYLRQLRRNIISNRPQDEYNFRPSSFKHSPQPVNNTNNFNEMSNLNLLEQLSKDEDYFKNQKLYQQFTNIYMEAIGPIMVDTKNILSIGSQLQFYQDEKTVDTLNKIRNNFFNNTKAIFDSELTELVIATKSIVQDNNMLLKDLNIQDPRSERSTHIPQFQEKPKNNGVQIQNINKNKRTQTQVNPYGIQKPLGFNHQRKEAEKDRNLRPSSSSQHLKYRPRPQSQWQSRKKDFQVDYRFQKQRPIIKVAKDQQNSIVQYSEAVKFTKNTTIYCSQAQDILLNVLFVNEGKNILVGSKDRNIYVYSSSTSKLVQKLIGHQASICAMANFGEFFASGGDNGCGSLIFWDTSQWKLKKKPYSHTAALTCIVDLLDGSSLATGGYDKRIQIYNYKRGIQIYESNACKSGLTGLAISEKTKKLISSSLDSTLTIWGISTKNGDVQSLSLEKIITSCGFVCSLRSLYLSGDHVIVGNKVGKVYFVNVHTGEISKTLTAGKEAIIQMAIIQRHNKPLYPIILSYSNNERQLFIIKTDTGIIQSSIVRSHISFGCGIGPKIILEQGGSLCIVSQSVLEKEVSIYTLDMN